MNYVLAQYKCTNTTTKYLSSISTTNIEYCPHVITAAKRYWVPSTWQSMMLGIHLRPRPRGRDRWVWGGQPRETCSLPPPLWQLVSPTKYRLVVRKYVVYMLLKPSPINVDLSFHACTANGVCHQSKRYTECIVSLQRQRAD